MEESSTQQPHEPPPLKPRRRAGPRRNAGALRRGGAAGARGHAGMLRAGPRRNAGCVARVAVQTPQERGMCCAPPQTPQERRCAMLRAEPASSRRNRGALCCAQGR